MEQVGDDAATVDLLGRSVLAGGLAGQLLGLRSSSGPGASFAVHLTGAWGSGKSSLTNLTVAALQEHEDAKDWVLPQPTHYLDAWRESQIGPAWWSLLTWLRQTVAHEHRWSRRPSFWLRELGRRLRLSGLAWPTIGLSAFAASVAWYLLFRANPDDQTDQMKGVMDVVTGLIAAGATAALTGSAFGRWLTWRSPAGARLFQRRDDNPMESVIEHATWLRRQIRGPIVLVIDDLDRCPAPFVVELLEAVQTLLRARPTTPARRPGRRPVRPLVVIVCADERWLHAAFEHSYAVFTDAVGQAGTNLGAFFLAKLFPLRLRVPDLDASSSVAFGRAKLRRDSHGESRAATTSPSSSTGSPSTSPLSDAEARRQIDAAHTFGEQMDVVDQIRDPKTARRFGVGIGQQAASTVGQAVLRHELEPYLPLVGPSPRAVVRFLNAYAIARMSVEGGSQRPVTDQLARWVIVELRWPSIACRLIANPDLIDRWHHTGIDHGDPDADVLRSTAFHNVVLAEDRTPALTTLALRRCLGFPTEDPV